ncbi:MAG TPA: hypothetical protein VL335_03515 [Candidatus Paceibacterota bacterium]|jgi:hypothetical protein|nr:hypothetical protein [Candidatus Paceibacterota bacterium]
MKIADMLKTVQSDRYAAVLRYLSFIFVGVVIFGAGIYVGHKVTEFSYEWSSNYSREFGGPHSPFFSDTDDVQPMPHGAFGSVVGINFPSFAIKGPHEAEKIVVIGSSTLIRTLHSQASTDDIRIGSAVIVIGEPDMQGRINATLVRIMPSPFVQATTSSSSYMLR